MCIRCSFKYSGRQKKPWAWAQGFSNWRRLTFPQGFPWSIISTWRLNRRVRNGNGCNPKRYRHQILNFVRNSNMEFRKKIRYGISQGNSGWRIVRFFRNVLFLQNRIQEKKYGWSKIFRSSPRSISMSKLNALLHLHLSPINLVFFKGSY